MTAVAVLLVNAPDAQGSLQLVTQSEQYTELPAAAAMPDAAYGGMATPTNSLPTPGAP